MRAAMGSIVVGAACLWPGIADAGSVTQKISYFAISGATLAELDRDLSRRGPYVAETGKRHPGTTEVRFDGEVSYKRGAAGCAVDRTNIRLELNMILPKWTPPKRVAAKTVLVWRTLEADIRRHQKERAKIARKWLTRMEMALRNLRPKRTCAAMEAQVNAVKGRYFAAHERAQVEFTTIEDRETKSRLRRALSRATRG